MKEPSIPRARRQLVASLALAALVLVACGEDDPVIEPEPDTTEDAAGDDDPIDADADVGDPDDDADDADADPGEQDAEDPEPLDGEATTEDREEEGSPPMVTVTDVRVASHDGFDRVVFEIGGDGQAGWGVYHQDEARSQGKGDEVEVAGDIVLEIGLRNIAMPFDAPDDVEAWDGPDRLEGPGDGPVLEIVPDTIFEGQHVFFVGLEAETPYRIQRLKDPQRVVIDLVAEPTG
jgi:hypothetical protein